MPLSRLVVLAVVALTLGGCHAHHHHHVPPGQAKKIVAPPPGHAKGYYRH